MVLLLNGLGKWTLLTLWLWKSIYKVMDLFIFLDMNISEISVFTSLEISGLISCTHLPPPSLHSHGLHTLFKPKLYYMYFCYLHSFPSPFLNSLIFLSLILSPRLLFSDINIAWCRIGIHREMVTGLC